MGLDRQIGILALLLRERFTTAGALAERFEVSQRTIYRDVERLCMAGIPLHTITGGRGGIYLMDGYTLDQAMLTNADQSAILAGLQGLDSVAGTNFYRQLMGKLSRTSEPAGDDCVVIDLASWYGPLLAPRLALLKKACLEARLVRFTYCAPTGDSRRTVEPYRLVYRWSGWYLWGWCRKRNDWRMFKLTRMLDLEAMDEPFRRRDVPSPLTPLEDVYPEKLKTVIRFTSAARWRLIDEYGPDSFTQEPDGSLLFSRGFPGENELFRWLLPFGGDAELLEPAETRQHFMDFVKEISGKYDSQLSYSPE